VAQNTPAQLGAGRVPMMDASMLDARTRPLVGEPAPIWLRHRLRHRLQRRTEPNLTSSRRAREWIDRLAGRSGA